MIVDELISLLGLEVDPKAEGQAAGFGKILGGVTKFAAAAGAALTAAAGAVSAYTAMQAEAIDAAGKFADSIGITYENLQSLEYATQRQGGSIDELRGDLDKLTKSMSSPVPGEYNQTLYQLGVATRDASGALRSADDVLLDIAGKFEGMSKQRQLQFAEKLGMTPGTIKLLQTGQAGIADLRGEAQRLGLVLDESSKEKAARFQDSLLNSKSVVSALGSAIAVGLMPAMADSMDAFTAFIGANGEFIQMGITQVIDGVALGFKMFAGAVGEAWDMVSGFLGPVGDMVGNLDATQAIAIAVAGALGILAVAVIAATWPFLLAGVAIAGIILILEDLYAAFTGQESVIGGWADSFAEAYPGITSALSSIIDAVMWLGGVIADILIPGFKAGFAIMSGVIEGFLGIFSNAINAIEAIISGANPFEVLSELFTKQIDKILGIADKVGGKLKSILPGWLGGGEDEEQVVEQVAQNVKMPTTDDLDKLVGAGEQAAGAVGEFFSGIFGAGTDVLNQVKGAFSGASANVPAGTMQSGGGAVINNNVTNNINGAGNPNAVANELMNRGGLGQSVQTMNPGMTGPVVG